MTPFLAGVLAVGAVIGILALLAGVVFMLGKAAEGARWAENLMAVIAYVSLSVMVYVLWRAAYQFILGLQ